MTTSRSSQVSLESTPWYHCTTRCVRRAFLCGKDHESGKDREHRKQWIEDRLIKLSRVFCIDIGAYAVMSNHYHVVLHVNNAMASKLTDDEVISRMRELYKPNAGMQRRCDNLSLTDEEQTLCQLQLDHWRKLLTSLSRFMAEVNQYIALRANREDDCTGRFWEARFHSQAILDTAALLRTLVYVDLNPVRSGQSTNVSTSQFTSIARRCLSKKHGLVPFNPIEPTTTQTPSTDSAMAGEKLCLPIDSSAYQQLLNWTARHLKGIDITVGHHANADAVITALGYSEKRWMRSQQARPTWHQRALGAAESIAKYCQSLNRHWIWQSTDHKIEA